MRSIDIGEDLFRRVVWHGPDKSIFRMGSCAGLRPLARAGERTLHTVRLSERCNSVAGFIITLALLLVPYQAGAAASSSCATGKTMCGARCVDLKIAPKNCGACGNVCAPGNTCSAGRCTGTSNANSNANSNATASCKAPKTMCGARCVNLKVAPKNCGACGNVCAPGNRCSNGVCSCMPGQTVNGVLCQ